MKTVGGNLSPFRAPCEFDATPKSFLGAKISRFVPDEVEVFANSTQMKDHCGNTVQAAPLNELLDACGNAICDSDCNDCPGGVDLVTNTPRPPAVSENTFSNIGTTQLAPAVKMGFKSVQAFKYWNGQFGFTFNQGSGFDCATGAVRSQTKYLTRKMEITSSAPAFEDLPAYSFTLERTVTVDRYTGIITLASCTQESLVEPFNPDAYTQFANDLTAQPSCDVSIPHIDVPTVASRLATCDPSSIVITADGSSGYTVDGTGYHPVTVESTRTETSYHWKITEGAEGETPAVYEGRITLSDTYTADEVYSDAVEQAAAWDLNEDLKYPFRTDGHLTIGPIVLRDEKQSTLDIFPPCQVDDYMNPVANDDGDAPFTSGWQTTPKWSQRDWFDPDAYSWVFPTGESNLTAAATDLIVLYSGGLIGSPLAAGYGQPADSYPRGIFDRDHLNVFRRDCPGPGWVSGSESLGAYTPDYLPANTPKWTSDSDAPSLWPCAFAHSDINGVYLQKWAEIPVTRPSVNFARPFGPDKFKLDETNVYYVFDYSSGVVTLLNNDFSTPTSLPFTTGDIVGGDRIGGFYDVTSVGTNTVTLGSKVFDVPAGWDTPSRDGADCFGKLRDPACPGMDFIDSTAEVGGRVAITVTNGSPVSLTTSTTQTYLSITTPENIDIYDDAMSLLAANVAATRGDATHFTVPTAYATITTAKWVTPTGTDYKISDSRSKGDYVFRSWMIDLDTAGVTEQTQGDYCLPTRPCGPSVVNISPNGETPVNGNLHAFPSTISNGQLWLGYAQFWMVDPFWQPAHKSVEIDGPWKMDGGDCSGDYAMSPFVEARCTLPSISGTTPPAPAGVDLTVAMDPIGQSGIANTEAPLPDAIILSVSAPWVVYALQHACVEAEGAFAVEYEANGS